eukprot:71818_1
MAEQKQSIPSLINRFYAASLNENDDEMCYSLLCIRQLCELDNISMYSSQILKLILSCNTRDQTQLEAMKCLLLIIPFIENHMNIRTEKDSICQMVLFGLINSNKELKLHSLLSIQKIIESYYDLSHSYIQLYIPTVIQICKQCTTTDTNITIEAIEVFHTIAEIELEFITNHIFHYGFINQSITSLVPICLSTLLTQKEEFKNVVECSLELFSRITTDKILEYVWPFVKRNIIVQDEAAVEAALHSFGCILNGPSHPKLSNLVKQILNQILKLMSHSSDTIRHIATWTFGRICDFIPESTKNNNNIKNEDILSSIVRALNDNNN